MLIRIIIYLLVSKHSAKPFINVIALILSFRDEETEVGNNQLLKGTQPAGGRREIRTCLY